jgi:hypothetical protein
VILARARAALIAAVLVATTVVAACGSAASPAASTVASDAAGSPAASEAGATPASADASAPAPTATPWPGDVAGAIIAIGAVDAQVAIAGQDMSAGLEAKDLARIQGAAEGMVTLLKDTQRFIDTAKTYPATKDVADAFDGAFGQMRDGAQQIADGVKAGNATGISNGFTALGDGLNLYALARKSLGPLLEQAIDQQKKYVK